MDVDLTGNKARGSRGRRGKVQDERERGRTRLSRREKNSVRVILQSLRQRSRGVSPAVRLSVALVVVVVQLLRRHGDHKHRLGPIGEEPPREPPSAGVVTHVDDGVGALEALLGRERLVDDVGHRSVAYVAHNGKSGGEGSERDWQRHYDALQRTVAMK